MGYGHSQLWAGYAHKAVGRSVALGTDVETDMGTDVKTAALGSDIGTRYWGQKRGQQHWGQTWVRRGTGMGTDVRTTALGTELARVGRT